MKPWWIGLVIILIAVVIAGYRFSCLECGPPSIPLLIIILGIMPAVYLTLMYLTFRSEADRQREWERDKADS